ncbi:solute carrier family 22 member 5-like, partial [Varroa jacobsoni]
MERVLEKLGPWHIPVFLLALLGSLPYGLFVLSLSFMAPKVNYWCKSPKGINYSEWMQMNAGVDLRCSVRVAVPQSNALHSNISQVESENCHEWEYDHSVHTKTLIEEWDAVCDHDWMLATAQSCLMFGVLVGCFVFSHISDWYGRKTALSLSLGICIIIGFGISFTNNYWLFCVLRFLMAFGHGGKRASSVLTTESVSAHHRAIVTVGQDVGWCLGLLLTPLITYYVRDWVWIQRAIIMPELAFVLLLCFVDESPKWLLSAGHEAKARRLLKKIIRVNKLYEEEIDIDQIVRDTTVALMKENRSQKSTLIDLLNEWTVLRLTISCWGQYAVIILLYYHMLYFIVDTGSDPYTGVFYMGLLELPIATLSCWVVNNFRRRPVYFWSYLLSVFSVVALLFPAD